MQLALCSVGIGKFAPGGGVGMGTHAISGDGGGDKNNERRLGAWKGGVNEREAISLIYFDAADSMA